MEPSNCEEDLLEALIVLGAIVGQDGYPGRVARFRLAHALRLANELYQNCYLIISGGRRKGTPISEARAMADWGLKWTENHWGKDRRRELHGRLIFEEKSLTTAASASNIAVLINEMGLKKAGLVTDSLHIHRARYLFNRHFAPRQLQLQALPAPGLYADYWRRRRWDRLGKLTLREAGAWVKVLLTTMAGDRRRQTGEGSAEKRISGP